MRKTVPVLRLFDFVRFSSFFLRRSRWKFLLILLLEIEFLFLEQVFT
jgi:hypothetical protein